MPEPFEQPGGGVGALADPAVHDDAPPGELRVAVAQPLDRNPRRVRDAPLGELSLGPDVEQHRTGVELGVELVPLDDAVLTAREVAGDVAEHVDGILRLPVLRGVGEFEVGERRGRGPEAHRGGEHVDSFVDAVGADRLRAEHAVGGGVDDELERHRTGARVIAGVRERVRVDDANGCPVRTRRALGRPRARHGDAGGVDDRGAERRACGACGTAGACVRRPAGDGVGDGTAVSVGEPGEGDEPGAATDGVALLGGVADGEDRAVARAVVPVDGDAAGRPDVEAGVAGEAGLGRDAHRGDHEIGGEALAVGEHHVGRRPPA